MTRFMRGLTPAAWAIVLSVLVAAPAAAAGGDDSATVKRTTTFKLSAATLKGLQPSVERAAQTSGGDTNFFTTPKGIAVVALIAAGFGYALYSKSHDRVKSPIR